MSAMNAARAMQPQSLPTGQPVAMPQPAMAQPAGGGQSPAPSTGAASAPQPQTPPQAPQVQPQAQWPSRFTPEQVSMLVASGRTPEQQATMDAQVQQAIKQIGADPRYTAAYMNMMRPMAGPQSLGAAGYRF